MADSPFVPEEERAEYVKSEYLKKVTPLDPLQWLPRIRAEKFRLQDELFDTRSPKTAKEKLRAAVPSNTTVTIYKSREEMGDHDPR